MSAARDDSRMVDDLLRIGDGLSEWEVGFAESLGRQRHEAEQDGRVFELSDKQRRCVRRILDEKG